MNRRNFLKGLLAAGGAAAAGTAVAQPRRREPDPDAVGMLYDSTRCIGCKACVVACREANGLAPQAGPEGTHDLQRELDANTKNVIKLYKDEQDPSIWAFMKQQCMHCVDPACVSVCMIGALHKGKQGVVEYSKDECIGCRYCQVACPFNVPKFEWASATPKIVKCELCPERRAEGRQPACTEVCPREAVVYGKVADLRQEAYRRLEANPGRYIQKVYGDTDMGGTQVLYLSAVPFEKLGLPEKGNQSVPYLSESIQHGVYQGFITPAVLYAGLAAVTLRNWRKGRSEDHEGGEEGDQ